MLEKTDYTVESSLLNLAVTESNGLEFKHSINEPTGDFFYDPWIIKNEYKDTVWEKILETLPNNIGEARIITLDNGKCYLSHSDIDDRYHLNISGQYSYLINLDTNTMHPLIADGVWYSMNAGPRHSAVNFGSINRIQLVVRKLLTKNNLSNPVSVKIYYSGSDKNGVRFIFDDVISPWLNKANKDKIITDFSHNHNDVRFKIENNKLEEFKKLLPENFKIDIL